MSFIIKLLKFFSGCIGSIFLFIVIFLLITSLVGLSLISNLDNLSNIMKSSTEEFISSHMPEIKEIINSNQSNQFEDIKINKTQVILICQNKESFIKQNQEYSKILNSGICEDIEYKSEEQIINEAEDLMIKEQVNELTSQLDSQEIISKINQQIDSVINQYSGLFFTALIISFLLGILFTFVAAGFDFIKGVYKTCLKLGIIFTLGVIPFIFVYLLTPSTVLGIASQYLTNTNLPTNILNLLIQLIAQITLTWIHSSLLSIFIFTIVTAIIFIIIAIILKIKVMNSKK